MRVFLLDLGLQVFEALLLDISLCIELLQGRQGITRKLTI